MDEAQALSKMVSPGMRRSGKRAGGVLQIWVTRHCDKACFGCTQGSNLAGSSGFITLEHFEQACISLEGYFGIVGVFGGNPCMHPEFPQLCEILRKYVPFQRRGLWANKLLGQGEACRKTFNPQFSNLNVHLDKKAYDEFKRDWPQSLPFGLRQDSRHGPPFVAMQDVIEDEEQRWTLIANCDINQHWSAMIAPFRGELRGYFCEIAGAQAILHQDNPDYPDTGCNVVLGWWRQPMASFANQVRSHCHACGVPLRGFGELAQSTNGTEQTSKTHEAIYKPKRVDRPVEVVERLEDVCPQSLGGLFTHYLQNAKAGKRK